MPSAPDSMTCNGVRNANSQGGTRIKQLENDHVAGQEYGRVGIDESASGQKSFACLLVIVLQDCEINKKRRGKQKQHKAFGL